MLLIVTGLGAAGEVACQQDQQLAAVLIGVFELVQTLGEVATRAILGAVSGPRCGAHEAAEAVQDEKP